MDHAAEVDGIGRLAQIRERFVDPASGRALDGYETIVWDWNGTLLDDLDSCLEIANELFEERGVAALSREQYRTIFDFPVRLYYERAGLRLDELQFRALSAEFCERFEQRLARMTLFSRASALVQALAARGTLQLVLSNSEHGSLTRQVERWGLSAVFAAVQGRSDTFATGKVEAGRTLLARSGVNEARAVLIGDTLHDAEVAAQLGMDCVLVAAGHQSAERLATAHCRVVASLDLLAAELDIETCCRVQPP
jgi:phosphoglycolate phosphatase